MVSGNIYCLRSLRTNNVYIGATTQNLKRRLQEHKNDFKLYLENKRGYISSFEIVKYNDVYIEELHESEFNTIHDIHLLERYFIEINGDNVVNQRLPTRTKHEYMIEYSRTRLNERYICQSCNGKYSRNSVYVHKLTNKHMLSLQ